MPFSCSSLLLELQPGGFFDQRGPSRYWALSAIFCIDNDVVEDRFVDWEKVTLVKDPRTKDGLYTKVLFTKFNAKPSQVLTVGVFVYPIAGNGERMNKVSSLDVVALPIVNNLDETSQLFVSRIFSFCTFRSFCSYQNISLASIDIRSSDQIGTSK